MTTNLRPTPQDRCKTLAEFKKKYKWRTLKDKNARDSHKAREG